MVSGTWSLIGTQANNYFVVTTEDDQVYEVVDSNNNKRELDGFIIEADGTDVLIKTSAYASGFFDNPILCPAGEKVALNDFRPPIRRFQIDGLTGTRFRIYAAQYI